MANYNKVILMGNLTRDPELKYTPGGTAVVEFGLATNRTYTSVSGERKEDVCFVDVSVFGRRAEIINEHMTKGQPILVEGRLKLDRWEGKDGQKRSKLRVVAETFQFVGKRGGGSVDEDGTGGSKYDESDIDAGDLGGGPSDDDIPF